MNMNFPSQPNSQEMLRNGKLPKKEFIVSMESKRGPDL